MTKDKIIVEDVDGGFIVAERVNRELENADEEEVKLYRYKEYYHDLESAIRDEF